MVAINFSVFLDKIEDGTKTQTIRKTARCKTGDDLQLYTGMRTKQCRLLGTATCHHVEEITITKYRMTAGCFRIDRGDQEFIASIDGFDSVDAMRDFFRDKYGLPFTGFRIMWNNFQPAAREAALVGKS